MNLVSLFLLCEIVEMEQLDIVFLVVTSSGTIVHVVFASLGSVVSVIDTTVFPSASVVLSISSMPLSAVLGPRASFCGASCKLSFSVVFYRFFVFLHT